ncbi:MAG TPA: BREX system ATP-binding domain-containing protein, partial [Acidimicrobiales bacterium]
MPTVDVSMLGGFVVAVDGVAVPDERWSRRAAANLVKLLALAPDRSLHRELVIDALWPDDTLDRAAPKLHKAAHYVRRAFDRPAAVVLRDERVLLFPDSDVTVDVDRFEALSSVALARRDQASARAAVDVYAGDLLPHDLYEPWSETRRDGLRLRHLDLLRLLERWDAVAELEPTDELAHLALMRRHAAAGDRHAALRQFERMERALRGDLGVAPGLDAIELRDRLLGDHEVVARGPERLVGRDRELGALRHALDHAAGGKGSVVIVSGAAGMGKSALLVAATERARELGFGVGRGVTATVEGSWPYAPVLEALADLCRQRPDLLDELSARDRDELEQASSGVDVGWSGDGSHQRLFVAALALVRAGADRGGLFLTIDDLHDADDASLRLLHHLARSTFEDHVCLVLAHRPTPPGSALEEIRRSLLARHAATEVVAGPLAPDQIDVLVRRIAPDAPDDVLRSIEAFSGGSPFAATELAGRASAKSGWVISLDADLLGGVERTTRDALQRVAVVGVRFDTDEFVAVSGLDDREAYARLDDALAAGVVQPT